MCFLISNVLCYWIESIDIIEKWVVLMNDNLIIEIVCCMVGLINVVCYFGEIVCGFGVVFFYVLCIVC